jgi:hypothetical protein
VIAVTARTGGARDALAEQFRKELPALVNEAGKLEAELVAAVRR